MLKDSTGIEISDFIRNTLNDEATQIIYISAKKDYDRKLFMYRPFDFIAKPFRYEDIEETIAKYIRIYGNNNLLFYFKYGNEDYWIDLKKVIYFKSNRKMITIVSIYGEYYYYDCISKITNKLLPNGFIMPHKSYLVNYHYINIFRSDTIIMSNGDVIPISKSRRKDIHKQQLYYESGEYYKPKNTN